MSIYRNLPRSVDEVLIAFELAQLKADIVTNKENDTLAFSLVTLEILKTLYPKFTAEVNERSNALQNQTSISSEKLEAKNVLSMFISHYFQGFNHGIDRGVFKPSERNYYRIDVNDNSVPKLITEADLVKWSKQIIQGEADRVSKGGKPMSMPTAAEVEGKYKAYKEFDKTQSDMKSEYDKEQEDVMNLMDKAIFLVRNIWDEVEFTYRYDDAASKRRKCREYGVVYVSRNGEEINEELIEEITGE